MSRNNQLKTFLGAECVACEAEGCTHRARHRVFLSPDPAKEDLIPYMVCSEDHADALQVWLCEAWNQSLNKGEAV